MAVLGALLLNGALTSILFTLGRAVSQIASPLPIPVSMPVAMAALAALFGIWRYRWTPESAEMENALDAALAAVERMTPQQEIGLLVSRLNALSPYDPLSTYDEMAEELLTRYGPDALEALHATAFPSSARDLLMLRLCDDPRLRATQSDLDGLRPVLRRGLQSDHASLRQQAHMLILTLIDEEVDRGTLPSMLTIRTAEQGYPKELAGLSAAVEAYLAKEVLAEQG